MTSVSHGSGLDPIFDRCWDGSFAYNTLTVSETEETIDFSFGGATIMPVEAGDLSGYQTIRSISFNKNDCRVLEDKRIMSCDAQGLSNASVIDLNQSENSEPINVELRGLYIDVSFVESANGTGFQTHTSHIVEVDTNEYETIESTVFFPATKERGCYN